MIIKGLNIISFGKLKNVKITFSEHLNVIYGRNESGKTTVSAFIEAMLYSFPPRSDRSKYLPWDNSTAAGEITVEADGRSTTFYRKFGTQPKGDELEPKSFSLKGLIPPDRDSYRKSVYSPEGGMGAFGTTDCLDGLISNLLTTGDESIGAQSAIKNLEKLRRSLNSGGKLKEYDTTISRLENEYTSALSLSRQSESITKAIAERENLVKEYEIRAKNAEDTAKSSHKEELHRLDSEIATQEEYINSFPSVTSPLPQKPDFLSKSIVFYILCSSLCFIAGFFIHWALFLCALLPVFVYFSLSCGKISRYKKLLKGFFVSVNCSGLDEYEKMLADKEAATAYYTSLLKKKSDLVSSGGQSDNSELLYRKILALRNELDDLKKSLPSATREPDVIKGELEYYKNLRLNLSTRLDAVRLAIEGINYAKDIIATDFTPGVTDRAMALLNSIAPKEGRTVSLSKDMSLTVSDGAHHPLSSHSFGFREEMYLCFRIAWAEFLFGKSFPIIIDDPFTGSDDYREKSLINMLFALSEDRQIIIFTNRKNELFNQLNCNWVDISPQNDV